MRENILMRLLRAGGLNVCPSAYRASLRTGVQGPIKPVKSWAWPCVFAVLTLTGVEMEDCGPTAQLPRSDQGALGALREPVSINKVAGIEEDT